MRAKTIRNKNMATFITILLALQVVRGLISFVNEADDGDGAGILAAIVMIGCYILGIVFVWNL